MGGKLSEAQRKVLRVLADAHDFDGFGYLNFRTISRRSRLDRRNVRLAARHLARKGFARYGRGLWTEDGDPFGSGYCCTPAGLALQQAPMKEDR